jgi:hypothetical protein
VLRLPFGGATAVVDPADGAVLALEHPARPGAPWLLDEATESWHSREHRWGTGLLISGAGRWNAPAELAIDGGRIEARHRLAGLELRVTRELGETWRERYALRNPGPDAVTVTGLGICTPWRDLYTTAADALRRAVHAHVHAGGAYSYVLAEPMDGAGPGARPRAARGRAVGVLDRVARADRDRLQRPRPHRPARHRSR